MIKCGCCGKCYRRKAASSGVVWICTTYNSRGKKYCPTSKQIPEDTLYMICCEVLKISEFDETLFRKQIRQILVPEPNVLTFLFHDGHEETVCWKNRSRSESWTSEMREKLHRPHGKGAERNAENNQNSCKTESCNIYSY